MKAKTLGEIFEHQKTLTKTKDKVEWLRAHASPGLFWWLQMCHNGTKWSLPEGAPPFTQDKGPVGITPSHLLRELRVLYLFFESVPNNLPQYRKEQLFRDLLERLDVNETALLIAAKDGSFGKTYRCTVPVVKEAFPGLLEAPFNPKYVRP